MCPPHRTLQLSWTFDQLTYTLPANVSPLRVLHTPGGRSCWVLKETQRAEAQSLSLSHTYADPHMQASQQRRSPFSPKATAGLHRQNRQMGRGLSPSSRAQEPAHHPATALAPLLLGGGFRALVSQSYDWVFSNVPVAIFLLLLPPPTQFGLAILRQLGFTYRGNTNSFPAK